jgi:hypothetical protein
MRPKDVDRSIKRPNLRLTPVDPNPFADRNTLDTAEGSITPRSLIPIPQAPYSPSPRPHGWLTPTYNSSPLSASTDHLPLPSPNRSRHYDILNSAENSNFSSRRTSWSSDVGSRDSRRFPFSPFDDSRSPSRAGSDDDNINTQTVSQKYAILPSKDLLVFPEDVEKDDYLHNPDPKDKERDCDIFTWRGIVNVGGLAFVILGILTLFIGYPVLYDCTCLAAMLQMATNPSHLL